MKGPKEKYPKKKLKDTFYNLKKEGLIEINKNGHQIYIKLTEKERLAGCK